MAEKNLNVRISLKYDSYANWTAEENQCVELKATNADSNVAPTVLFKVGDGTRTFNQLDWASAKAADVHAWAKLENPTPEDLPSNLKKAITQKAYIIDNFYIGDYPTVSNIGSTTANDGNPQAQALLAINGYVDEYKLASTLTSSLSAGSTSNIFLKYLGSLYPACEVSANLSRNVRLVFRVVDDLNNEKIITITTNPSKTTVTGAIEDYFVSELNDSTTKAPTSNAVKTYVDDAIQAVKDYSDNNDTNTAHTHKAGAGTTVSATGGKPR